MDYSKGILITICILGMLLSPLWGWFVHHKIVKGDIEDMTGFYSGGILFIVSFSALCVLGKI